MGDREGLGARAMHFTISYQEGPMSTVDAGTRALGGVRHISYGNPSAVCFVGSVMALMEYLKDPIDIDELFALSGVALCVPGRYRSCCDEVSIIPDIPQRTFRALGYPSEYLYEPDIRSTQRAHAKEWYRAKIQDSIDKGRPVLGFGFTHPDPFACVIAGYGNYGDRMLLRAYWTPGGTPTGSDAADAYFAIDDWYDRCYGIVVVGERTQARLSGAEALSHIRETAAILRARRNISIQGQPMAVGFSAYDEMIAWLLNDDAWKRVDEHHGVYLAPCGLLLLEHYRSALHRYLAKAFEEPLDARQRQLLAALLSFGDSIGGADSRLHLDEKVSAEITDYERLTERRLREKVAAFVERLRGYDTDVFDCLERL
jgi:hypothetical protein